MTPDDVFQRGTMMRALSTVGYLLMVAGILGLIWLREIFSPLVPVIVVQCAAVALMVWARISFGRRSFHLAANPTQGGLVTWGPYRYIRHPIYTSVCLFVAASVAAHFSASAVALGLMLLAGTLVRIFCEETLIPAQYPEYKEYAARTWRIIPFVF